MAAAALLVLAVAGCGGGNSSEQVTSVIPNTVPEPASATTGPLGRICDKRLAHRVGEVIGARGFRGEFGRAAATGSERLSQCRLEAPGAEVQFSLDAAADARQRYFNRITESAQFSSGDPELAPQPVEGVGARSLPGAGANWIPAFHELLSVRGDRLLIASVSARHLRDRQLMAAAVALSLYVYERLSASD